MTGNKPVDKFFIICCSKKGTTNYEKFVDRFISRHTVYEFTWAFGIMKKRLGLLIPDSTEEMTIFDYTLINDFEP